MNFFGGITYENSGKGFYHHRYRCGIYYHHRSDLGFVALNQMKTQKPSTAVCVLVLLFCNLIGGILLLCSDESEYGV